MPNYHAVLRALTFACRCFSHVVSVFSRVRAGARSALANASVNTGWAAPAHDHRHKRTARTRAWDAHSSWLHLAIIAVAIFSSSPSWSVNAVCRSNGGDLECVDPVVKRDWVCGGATYLADWPPCDGSTFPPTFGSEPEVRAALARNHVVCGWACYTPGVAETDLLPM